MSPRTPTTGVPRTRDPSGLGSNPTRSPRPDSSRPGDVPTNTNDKYAALFRPMIFVAHSLAPLPLAMRECQWERDSPLVSLGMHLLDCLCLCLCSCSCAYACVFLFVAFVCLCLCLCLCLCACVCVFVFVFVVLVLVFVFVIRVSYSLLF
jgi:hypothetical protein